MVTRVSIFWGALIQAERSAQKKKSKDERKRDSWLEKDKRYPGATAAKTDGATNGGVGFSKKCLSGVAHQSG